jgi:hemerythrin
MSEWLKKHITGSDRKFGEFMRKQQIATMLTDNRASPQP